MPTYAPVPESFKRLSHRGEVLFLYRHILKQAAAFFDQRASEWMIERTRSGFRQQIRQRDPARIHKKLSDARKALRTIERANRVDQKAIERILRLAYGIEGRERQRLLQPFVQSARVRTHSALALSHAVARCLSPSIEPTTLPSDASSRPTPALSSSTPSQTPAISPNSIAPPPPPAPTAVVAHTLSSLQQQLFPHLQPQSLQDAPTPLHFQYERSIPPIYSPAMIPLLKTSGARTIYPELPMPQFKPLHGKREANLRWRHFTKLVKRIQAPLPTQIRREMEFKARLGLPKQFATDPTTSVAASIGTPSENDIFPTEWAAWEHQLLTVLREWRKRGEKQREDRWETPRFHPSIGGKPAKAHVMTLRFYRRLWQRLLDETPILQIRWTEGHPEEVGTGGSRKKQKDRKYQNDNREERDALSQVRKENMVATKAPSFSTATSHYSAASRRAVSGLKLQALVSDFDRLGLNPLPSSDGATASQGQASVSPQQDDQKRHTHKNSQTSNVVDNKTTPDPHAE